MIEGLGFPIYNTIIFVICLIINVFFIILLTESYGNLGIAIGRLAGFGTMFFSVFYVEKWIFNRIQIVFWLKLIGFLSIAAVVSAFVQKIIIVNFSINWASFLVATVAGGICYCLTLLIMGFVSAEDKILLRNILSR
jgi:hypothetical protein